MVDAVEKEGEQRDIEEQNKRRARAECVGFRDCSNILLELL